MPSSTSGTTYRLNELADMTEEWKKQGYIAARQLIDSETIDYLASLDVDSGDLSKPNELKRLWMTDTQVRQLATSQTIRHQLDSLFENSDYYLWGAQIIDREPDQIHLWHSDNETSRPEGGFVSLWIGISGVDENSTLMAIPGSHTYGVPVQKFFAYEDPARYDSDGVAVLEKALEYDSEASIMAPSCNDGDGIFFDGRLWHGTFNHNRLPRRTLLLQYGKRGIPIRFAKDYMSYPFVYNDGHASTPPVMPVQGKPDPLVNHNVLEKNGQLTYTAASIAVQPELANKKQLNWAAFPYFNTPTRIFRKFSCHASELLPGCMPHMPHDHDDEEILLVLSGTATIFINEPGKGALRAYPSLAGDFFYYPSGQTHTIYNGSEEPIQYLMFRWSARAAQSRPAKTVGYKKSFYDAGNNRLSVNHQSSGLKHLHMHFTRLQPGQSFKRHVDQYDTAIIVLEGELSVLNQRLGRGGVFFIRAGELHNTHNEGTEPCAYLVFEFHADTATTIKAV
ncbi:cupin domain-containing protein [Solemya velum gill symbiont]|uniref:cupin domain-containing protein n=1 Tax=Solemya velum gill symbiont TaxID=2340 RepID=UPI0015C3C7D8|nr:cupin domain-containing protein [Solemya velum gill symbiont]